MSGLRVGKVNFTNTLPMFHPLETGAVRHDFRIIEGPPAVLNELLAAGELDLGVVSSVEYARRFQQYWLLPDLSISSRTRIGSVLLLSRVPLAELDDREVLLTPKSHTSVALLKLLFAGYFRIRPRYRVASDLGGPGEPATAAAMLAIGDDALRLRKISGMRHVIDLGAAWHEWTGHSFVFAVWALRRETMLNRDGEVYEAFASLLAAKDYGLENLEAVADGAGSRSWLSRQECLRYLQTINYDLGSDKQAGMRLFFDMLFEAGELPERAEINFLPQRSEPL